MNEETELKRQIRDIVTKFEADQMRITPELISVAIEPTLLIVTLMGITSQAERQFAQRDDGKALLERLYEELFDSVKQLLERAISKILEQQVLLSSMSVHPDTGHGVMMFTLGCKLSSKDKELP